MIFGTWNVRSLRQPGALTALIMECEQYKLDLVALQEVRWDGNGISQHPKYTLFYSGGDPGKGLEFGMGFLVSKRILANVRSLEPINRYLSKIRLKGMFRNISIICAHAPHE
jgi:exonuclease III